MNTQGTDIKAQAGKVLSHVSGYVCTRTIEIGIKTGLLEQLAKHPEGMTAEQLSDSAHVDPFYAQVWLRAAYSAEIIECDNPLPREDYDPVTKRFSKPGQQRFHLAEHMATLLLDESHPAYVGGLPQVMLQREFFELFSENLASGQHIWWKDLSPSMIRCVSRVGLPFYTRMIPGGFSKVPGLQSRLQAGAKLTELACGAGRGLVKMAQIYPHTTFVGLDGDAHSLDRAKEHLEQAGVSSRVEFVDSTLEDMNLSDQDVVFINIAMHECRDIDRVTENVYSALKPGGVFVISDFPFPETVSQTRTVPARILCGIQYFEALIDDQLMPTIGFVELLQRHGFKDVGTCELSPVHAITYGTR